MNDGGVRRHFIFLLPPSTPTRLHLTRCSCRRSLCGKTTSASAKKFALPLVASLPSFCFFCFFRVVEYAIISLRLLRSRLNHNVFREIRNSAGIIHSNAKFVHHSRPSASVLSSISRENFLTSNVIKASLGVYLLSFSAEMHDNSF